MLKTSLRKQKGEGLVEVVVTAVIVTIGLVALLRYQGDLTFNNNLLQQQKLATNLAQNQIETLRNFQVLNTQSPYTAYQSIQSGSSSYTGPTATYNIVWTVTPYTNPTYKSIDITVTWTDIKGASRNVSFSTRVAGLEPTQSASVMY